MMLKNVFGEIQKYTYGKKSFLDHIQKIPPYRGRDIICHAILHHPLSVRKICRQKRCEDKNNRTDRPSQVADVYKNNQEMYISHGA